MSVTPVKPLVWLHDESLGADAPAVQAFANAPRIVVLDDAYLAERGWGLKRLAFIYECALGSGAEIWRGATTATLLERMAACGCDGIAFTKPVSPGLKAIAAGLARQTSILAIAPPPLAEPGPDVDLRRFTRYWKLAEASALGGTARGTGS
ncbi:MAG: hypothetical protein RJQ21_11540 [Rhodospirillales bacterium]